MAFVYVFLPASKILKSREIYLHVQITLVLGICLQTATLLFTSYDHSKTTLAKEI